MRRSMVRITACLITLFAPTLVYSGWWQSTEYDGWCHRIDQDRYCLPEPFELRRVESDNTLHFKSSQNGCSRGNFIVRASNNPPAGGFREIYLKKIL